LLSPQIDEDVERKNSISPRNVITYSCNTFIKTNRRWLTTSSWWKIISKFDHLL